MQHVKTETVWEKKCLKRHPKDCSKYKNKIGCRFKEECLYRHVNENELGIENKREYDELIEDVRNLKEEVELLKHTVKSHSSIIQEDNMIKKLINDMKDDIQKIKDENHDLVQKFYLIEKRISVW